MSVLSVGVSFFPPQPAWTNLRQVAQQTFPVEVRVDTTAQQVLTELSRQSGIPVDHLSLKLSKSVIQKEEVPLNTPVLSLLSASNKETPLLCLETKKCSDALHCRQIPVMVVNLNGYTFLYELDRNMTFAEFEKKFKEITTFENPRLFCKNKTRDDQTLAELVTKESGYVEISSSFFVQGPPS